MKPLKIKDSEMWAYISKTADISTKTKIENWKNSGSYNEEFVKKLTKIHLLTGIYKRKKSFTQKNKEIEYDKFLRKTGNKHQNTNSFLKYVAVVVFLLISSVFIYQGFSTKIILEETGYGKLKEIKLPDGSKIWLNSKSEISYTKTTPRTVYLEGEAFFDVTEDKEHPFIVKTSGDIVVKALGTSFNIKAYPLSTYYEIVLFTGKVEVSFKGTKLMMLPNDKITILKTTGETYQSTVDDVEVISSWREGKIQFKNKTFKDIAQGFEFQYGVKINFENDEIANSRFTGKFEKTISVGEILEVLKSAKYFEYQLVKERKEWVIR